MLTAPETDKHLQGEKEEPFQGYPSQSQH